MDTFTIEVTVWDDAKIEALAAVIERDARVSGVLRLS
jgi:hypothetical protein